MVLQGNAAVISIFYSLKGLIFSREQYPNSYVDLVLKTA